MIRHRLIGAAVALAATTALTVPSLSLGAADARPAAPVDARAATLPFTKVTINSAGKISLPASFKPGWRTVKVVAAVRAEAAFVHLKPGYTLDMLIADLGQVFSQQPDLAAINRFYDMTVLPGGLVAKPGTPAVGRLKFAAGKYYAFNPQAGPPTVESFTAFMVTGTPSTVAPPKPTRTITALRDDLWAKTPASIPARGWLRFVNKAQSPHFIELAKLAKGKTYADFKAWMNKLMAGKNPGPPPFGKFALDQGVVTQGRSYQFKYDIPRGRYVVLCFMPDRKMGMPHAFMGMHRPLTVK